MFNQSHDQFQPASKTELGLVKTEVTKVFAVNISYDIRHQGTVSQWPPVSFHPVNLKQQTDFVTCSSTDTEAGVNKKTGVDS